MSRSKLAGRHHHLNSAFSQVRDRHIGRASDLREVNALTGGVASDRAAIRVGDQRYCVKFALAKLKVAADWRAPVYRNAAEYAWLQVAADVVPKSAVRLYGRSETAHGFAMELVSDSDSQRQLTGERAFRCPMIRPSCCIYDAFWDAATNPAAQVSKANFDVGKSLKHPVIEPVTIQFDFGKIDPPLGRLLRGRLPGRGCYCTLSSLSFACRKGP